MLPAGPNGDSSQGELLGSSHPVVSVLVAARRSCWSRAGKRGMGYKHPRFAVLTEIGSFFSSKCSLDCCKPFISILLKS